MIEASERSSEAFSQHTATAEMDEEYDYDRVIEEQDKYMKKTMHVYENEDGEEEEELYDEEEMEAYRERMEEEAREKEKVEKESSENVNVGQKQGMFEGLKGGFFNRK